MNTGSREKWDAHFFTASIFMETKDGLHGNGRRAAPFPAPWHHVLRRYQIAVQFTPDGENHTIACVFESDCLYERTPESGDRLECQSFYNDCGFKMSIDLECEGGYVDGKRFSNEYDYDSDYLANGMAFLIDRNTQTERYVFGISWIDNVIWNDHTEDNRKRDVETWYGADPMIGL